MIFLNYLCKKNPEIYAQKCAPCIATLYKPKADWRTTLFMAPFCGIAWADPSQVKPQAVSWVYSTHNKCICLHGGNIPAFLWTQVKENLG